jgi:hypothetical protein
MAKILKTAPTKFLPSPAEIRKAIHGLATRAKSLDLAVAFIGPEWQRLLANYPGPIRAICWLTHPATDPDAVETLINRSSTFVKQRNGLHTKVYLAPGVGAVVGSANLSRPALTDLLNAPQCEAAVLVLEPKLFSEVSRWFGSLWNDHLHTTKITDSNLERARKEREKFPVRWPHTINAVPPPPDELPKWMIRMARAVARIPLEKKFKDRRDLIQSLASKESLSAKDVAKLADTLAGWTKHRAVYRNFEEHSRKKTLEGLRMLVDESRDIYDRLKEIKEKKLLRGLQIPAISVLLYWLRPDAYPPFNAKTRKFLEDSKMDSAGMSSSSPACYTTWLGFAELLRAKLHLPTVGHVDRVVTRYYDGLKR